MNLLLTLVMLIPSADARPAWADAPAGLRDGAYYTQTIIGPEASRAECDKRVVPAVRMAFEDYASRWSRENGYGETLPQMASPSDEQLERRIVADKWEEHVKVDGADRIFLHLQLKFDATLQNEWRAGVRYWLTERRGIILTFVFLAAMWGVAVLHVGLRVDGTITGERARTAKAVLWTTAGLLAAVPLLIVA